MGKVKQKIIIIAITLLIAVPVISGASQLVNKVAELNKIELGDIIFLALGIETEKKPCSKRTANFYMRFFRGDAKDLQWLKESNGIYFILKHGEVPRNERYKIATFFISKGFDVNTKLEYDFTALHGAVGKNSKEDVAFLLSKGADINIATTVNLTNNDKSIRDALEYATALSKIDGNDRTAIIELLTNRKSE